MDPFCLRNYLFGTSHFWFNLHYLMALLMDWQKVDWNMVFVCSFLQFSIFCLKYSVSNKKPWFLHLHVNYKSQGFLLYTLFGYLLSRIMWRHSFGSFFLSLWSMYLGSILHTKNMVCIELSKLEVAGYSASLYTQTMVSIAGYFSDRMKQEPLLLKMYEWSFNLLLTADLKLKSKCSDH